MSTKNVLLEPQHLLDPALEHTLIVVKPDGHARGLTGEILRRIEAKSYMIEGLKPMIASRELFVEHYADHKDKLFFEGLLEFMNSGPVVAIIIEGQCVIEGMRVLMGSTDPTTVLAGTIRDDLGCAWNNPYMENLVHGSDSMDNATHEIFLWLPEVY